MRHGTFDEQKNEWTLNNGQVLKHIHSKKNCKGDTCPVHSPTNHLMADWDHHWDWKDKMLYRVCQCIERHPDPDDFRSKTMDCICSCRCCEGLSEEEIKSLIAKFKG